MVSVLGDELGHDVAFAVEAGKIGANAEGTGEIDLGVVERKLAVTLEAEKVSALLSGMTDEMAQAALRCVAQAQVAPDARCAGKRVPAGAIARGVCADGDRGWFGVGR